MPGFGAAVRAMLFGAASTFIAALVNRVTTPILDITTNAPVVTGENTPQIVTSAIGWANAATDQLLLVLILSTLVMFLAQSYTNSEVSV